MTKKVKKKGIELSIHASKGEERTKHLQHHLSNTNESGQNFENKIFADIGFDFEEGTPQDVAVSFVEQQKEMIFQLLGGVIPGFQDLFAMFATCDIIKGILHKNTVILRIKGEASLQQTIEGALGHAYQLIEALPKNQTFLFRVKSKYTFDDIFKNNFTLFQALKGYEVELKVNLLREYIRKVAEFTGDKQLGILGRIITAPDDLSLNLKMDIDNLVPQQIKEKSDIPLGMVKEMVNGIVDQFLGEGSIAHKVKSVNLTLNAFELYAHIKVVFPGLLTSK